MEFEIEPSWRLVLEDEFSKPYFESITEFLNKEIASGKTIYPPRELVFAAFDKTPFDKVKVVILGQDPYHGKGQAHGLCFSVEKGAKIPPSLVNIYKEIKNDLGIAPPDHGCLESWANQGVFMLNAILTVGANEAASHSKIGWQKFTDAVLRKISEEKQGVVFLLWGNFARSKKNLIDTNKHLVLEAAHPSPLARGAFMGSKHFSKTNDFLKQQGKSPIIWEII